MPAASPPKATLSVLATFPEKFFLENLAVRADNSLLVSDLTRKGLWYLPPARDGDTVDPVLLASFEQPTLSMVEVEPDVFLVATSNLYTTHESFLHRLDMRGWAPGAPAALSGGAPLPRGRAEPERELPRRPGRPAPGRQLRGPDLARGLRSRRTRPRERWLKHYSMGHDPNGGKLADQPGINGLRFVGSTSHVYYTSTVHKLFMRVRVDSITRAALGEPEMVASGFWYDDFCVDEERGLAYVTTHRENTLEAVWLEPGRNVSTEPAREGSTSTGQVRHVIAGDPFDDRLVGPSSAAWGRQAGETGRVAFLTSDGGTKAPPPDGVVRPAKVLRVTFDAA